MAAGPGFGERLRYQFDKSMAAGPIALIGYLAIISVAIVAVAGLFLALTGITPEGGERLSFLEGFWAGLMRTLDSGTMGGDAGWGFRLVMLLVTLTGIFVVSALIGVLSSGLDAKLEELRKGRSRVLESGHTVILNWSPSIFDIIAELQVANASERRARFVIMADKDKVEMEDELKAKVVRARNAQFICRSGRPTDLYDLKIVSPQEAKSIIVLSPQEDDPDSQVVKTILALVNDPSRAAGRYRIAAEIRDAGNAEIARVVGGDELQLVLADEILSRIVAHSSRQSGLSAVYSELLDFDGCEIYTTDQPALAGRTFGEAVLAYDTSTLIGLSDGHAGVMLNPPADTVIGPDHKAIIIAEDDSAIRLSDASAEIAAERIRDRAHREFPPERLLLLGWNRRGAIVARELARFTAPGSHLTLAGDAPGMADAHEALLREGGSLTVVHQVIDTTSRAALDALDVPSYDAVMVLGYSDDLPPETADTRTLVTLLHLRQIEEASGKHVKVVSEMADVRNRELAEVTKTDDFVVSNKLVSQMLAQASENPYIERIFTELLDEQGSEIYMRPVEEYAAVEGPTSFYTLAESARRRGEIALGYCRAGGQDATGRGMGGVVINPRKSEAVSFAAGDRLIVLAEG